jgi:hypothetical protein
VNGLHRNPHLVAAAAAIKANASVALILLNDFFAANAAVLRGIDALKACPKLSLLIHFG